MNNFIIKKNISESIYIAKFIAIVLVVFVHTYNFLPETMNSCLAANIEYIISRIIAASAVPLFFLFSSILLYRNNFNWFKNIKKKIYTLLIPYLILSTFAIVFSFMIQDFLNLKYLFNDNIVSNWNFYDWLNAYIGYRTNLPLVRPFWYLRNLLVLNIIAPLFQFFLKNKSNYKISILFIVYLIFAKVEQGDIFSQALVSIFYWSLGCYIVKQNIDINKLRVFTKQIWILIYIVFIAIDFYTIHLSINPLIRCFNSILGVYLIFVHISNINTKSLKDKLISLSAYTVPIYLFHELSLTYIKKICKIFIPTTSLFLIIEYFLLAVLIIIYCIIISKILYKLFPTLYIILTGNRMLKTKN